MKAKLARKERRDREPVFSRHCLRQARSVCAREPRRAALCADPVARNDRPDRAPALDCPELNSQAQPCKVSRHSHPSPMSHDHSTPSRPQKSAARSCCAMKSRCSICGTRPPSPRAIRCLPPTWRPGGSRSKPRRGCPARMCRSLSTMPARVWLPQAGDRLAGAGIHRRSPARRRARGLAEGGL